MKTSEKSIKIFFISATGIGILVVAILGYIAKKYIQPKVCYSGSIDVTAPAAYPDSHNQMITTFYVQKSRWKVRIKKPVWDSLMTHGKIVNGQISVFGSLSWNDFNDTTARIKDLTVTEGCWN